MKMKKSPQKTQKYNKRLLSQLYANKVDNSEEMDKFLEIHRLSK